MTSPIRNVCVIGGGVMGSGIAAHLANAGCRVLLLDIVPPNLSDDEKKDKKARDRFAQGGLDKALKSRPAAFFHASFANSVRIGNTEDDLEKASDCDLVIEAIIEKLEPKQALFTRLEKIVPRAHDRGLEHVGPAHRVDDGRPHGRLQEALLRDALLQPGPLHEAARARGRAGHGARDDRAHQEVR
jgi:NAD(P)-dependent dehydrogenase (short-subunit alcohol dehydrogenase family)